MKEQESSVSPARVLTFPALASSHRQSSRRCANAYNFVIESVEVLTLVPQVHISRANRRTVRRCANVSNLERVCRGGDLGLTETHLKVMRRFSR